VAIYGKQEPPTDALCIEFRPKLFKHYMAAHNKTNSTFCCIKKGCLMWTAFLFLATFGDVFASLQLLPSHSIKPYYQ
jgi:hypothetical protein